MIEREENNEYFNDQDGKKKDDSEIEYVNLYKFNQLYSSISLILRTQIEAELEREEKGSEGEREERNGDKIKYVCEEDRIEYFAQILVDRNDEILFNISCS